LIDKGANMPNRFDKDLAAGGIIGGGFAIIIGILYILGTSIAIFDDHNYDRDVLFLANLGAYTIFCLGIAAIITGLCSSYNVERCRKIIFAIAISGLVISTLLASFVGFFIWLFPFTMFVLTARK
jgi:hypothetical protein